MALILGAVARQGVQMTYTRTYTPEEENDQEIKAAEKAAANIQAALTYGWFDEGSLGCGILLHIFGEYPLHVHDSVATVGKVAANLEHPDWLAWRDRIYR
jgi:hypothetical protein